MYSEFAEYNSLNLKPTDLLLNQIWQLFSYDNSMPSFEQIKCYEQDGSTACGFHLRLNYDVRTFNCLIWTTKNCNISTLRKKQYRKSCYIQRNIFTTEPQNYFVSDIKIGENVTIILKRYFAKQIYPFLYQTKDLHVEN